MGFRGGVLRRIGAVLAVGLALAAAAGCGGTAPDSGDPTRAALPTGVTTAGAGQTATLRGLDLVVVRTLPVAAISAEALEPAGTADASDGGTLALARATAPGVAAWEYVSAAADGWRVWRPAVLDALTGQAGAGAAVVEVHEEDWPDACLGLSRQDEVCLQAITPGLRVIVEQGGKRIEYHTARTGGFRRAP